MVSRDTKWFKASEKDILIDNQIEYSHGRHSDEQWQVTRPIWLLTKKHPKWTPLIRLLNGIIIETKHKMLIKRSTRWTQRWTREFGSMRKAIIFLNYLFLFFPNSQNSKWEKKIFYFCISECSWSRTFAFCVVFRSNSNAQTAIGYWIIQHLHRSIIKAMNDAASAKYGLSGGSTFLLTYRWCH